MSTGMVICSLCKREVHQWGDKAVRKGWEHCFDLTPICEGATADYPTSWWEIVGAFCEADGKAPKRPAVEEK